MSTTNEEAPITGMKEYTVIAPGTVVYVPFEGRDWSVKKCVVMSAHIYKEGGIRYSTSLWDGGDISPERVFLNPIDAFNYKFN